MFARADAIEEAVDFRAQPTDRVDLLVPGPKMLLMALTALPPIVIGLSAETALEVVGAVIAGMWFWLLPAALYRYWATRALPFVATALLVFTVLGLPFNSSGFIVDFWSAAMMLILGLPKR